MARTLSFAAPPSSIVAPKKESALAALASHYTRLNAIKNKAGAWEFTNKNREAATKSYEPEQKKATTDDLIIAASV